jgi:NAD(P)H dehydrogenase (quinone)
MTSPRVAARVFADRARYAAAVLDITGPEAVSYADVAGILTELTGRSVTHVDVSVDEGRSALRDGRPEWEVQGLLANWLMTRDGSGGFDRVTDDVERVTGRRPRELRIFLGGHVDAVRPQG